MASQQLLVVGFTALLVITVVSSQSSLHKILKKRDVVGDGSVPSEVKVALVPAKAKEFLAKLRPKRNIWDRSRPDVQQWIMQYMYMGFDEARLETDLSYWKDQFRSSDQGRQHHYDENAPIRPRVSHRHGADVNYDYY